MTSTDIGKSIDRNIIIKAGFVLALIIFLIIVYRSGSAKDIDLTVISDRLENELSIEKEMKKATDRDVMEFFGLDSGSFEQVVYYRNTKELAVEELLIVKAASKDELGQVSEAVDRRTESQIDVYKSYGPKQVKQLKGCIKIEKGSYYFYCTSDNAAAYEEVFRNAI